MSDYGHELRFGSFLTPSVHDPDQVVALAELTEAAGLDLVTFQDHPYNAELLDTWTLLSWVAARTERLRISGNVLSLPLRPPAVLARAAASLDRLSHGRFELGLGAGAFWDGIEGMGARRLTAGQESRPCGRPSTSCAASGTTPTPGRCGWTGSTTPYPACSAARSRHTPSTSGSARTSRRCWP